MTPEQSLDESPFISIWDAPRATIRQIVDRDPRRWVNSLFFAAGVIATLSGFTAASEVFPVPIPLAAVPALCIVTGILAIPLRHLGAWYKRLIGRLLGGEATQREIVGHGALWIVRFALYGTEVLLPEHPTIDASSGLVQLSLGIAATLFSLWSAYVSIVGFAEVNRFSVARSVATSVLTPVLILTAGVAILVGVIVFRASR
jgi:hypothetical protein